MNKFSIRKRLLEIFEKNNVTIVLNVLYTKKSKIYPTYVAKHNSNGEKRVILLMIPNGKKLLSFLKSLSCVKRLSALLKEIT